MTDGYKIKRVLVWQNGEEKQIYPANKGWGPNANTMGYYKLESDTADYSGRSHDATNSGITFTTLSTGKKVGYLNGSSYAAIADNADIRGGNNRTQLVWYKYTSGGSVALDLFAKGTDAYSGGSNVFRIGLRSDIYNVLQYGFSTSSSATYPTGYTWTGKALNGDWHLLGWTFGNKIFNIYGDGQLLSTANMSSYSYSFSNTSVAYIGCQNPSTYRFNGYMSELILENKERTADEVSSYYNQTKSNYGL